MTYFRSIHSLSQSISTRYLSTVATINRSSLPYDRTLLQGFTCITPIDVLWGSQDAFQHVNNVVYSRWCEQSRIHTFESFIQFAIHNQLVSNTKQLKQFMSTRSIGPILKSITIKYRSPVVYPDTVIMGSAISSVQFDRMSMQHRIISIQQNAIVADANDTIVTYDYINKCKSDMPNDIYNALQQYIAHNNESIVPYKPKSSSADKLL